MTPPPPDTFLFAFWTGIFAGFTYLWATMLVAWYMHRDSRALVYVTLLGQLSLISGINVVIRSGFLGIDSATLVAVQRGLWFAALATSFAVVDIYKAQQRGKPARVMRVWYYLVGEEQDGIESLVSK